MYTPGTYILYKEHMNLREKPNARAQTIGILPQGSVIEVDEISDNWGKVKNNHVSGWCCISECFAKKCESAPGSFDACARCNAL